MSIYSEIFGEDQYDVGVIANNLAMLLHVQEKYPEAEHFYQRALSIKSARLGKDHPDVQKLLGNYSNLLRACNRVEDAEKLQSDETLITAKNWAKTKVDQPQVYRNNGQPQQQAVETPPSAPVESQPISKNIPREPLSIAVSRWENLRRLAELADQDRRLADVEAIWAAAVRYFEPFASDDPRRLAYALDCFADSLCSQEKHEMAEPYYRRAIDIKVKHLGEKHIVVARSLNNLARLYYQLNRFHEAEPLTKRCVEIYLEIFGNRHPDYATALHNLGTLYHIQVRFRDAEPLYREALQIRNTTLGPDHPETKGLARSLANLLRATGREEEAKRIHGAKVPVITGTWRALAVPEDQQLLPDSY